MNDFCQPMLYNVRLHTHHWSLTILHNIRLQSSCQWFWPMQLLKGMSYMPVICKMWFNLIGVNCQWIIKQPFGILLNRCPIFFSSWSSVIGPNQISQTWYFASIFQEGDLSLTQIFHNFLWYFCAKKRLIFPQVQKVSSKDVNSQGMMYWKRRITYPMPEVVPAS